MRLNTLNMPAFETVLELPGYTVPEESGFTWIPGFVPVSEVVREEEGSCLRLLEEPHPPKAVTTTMAPLATDLILPTVPPTPDENVTVPVMEGARKTERAQVFVVEGTEGSPSSAKCADTNGFAPDLSREGPFDACEADHETGQSPMVLDSMSGCQYRMTSYKDRTNRDDLDPSYGIHLHDPPYDGIYGGPRISSPTRPDARILARTYGSGTDSAGSAPIAP